MLANTSFVNLIK
jgi:hypothetical protein